MKQVVFDRYAIFQTGGKQYQAIEGKTVAIEKLNAEVGDMVTFDDVLLRKPKAGSVQIGQPFVTTAVKARVIKQGKGKKVTVFKFKRRKMYRKKTGHRQLFTIVRIESI